MARAMLGRCDNPPGSRKAGADHDGELYGSAALCEGDGERTLSATRVRVRVGLAALPRNGKKNAPTGKQLLDAIGSMGIRPTAQSVASDSIRRRWRPGRTAALMTATTAAMATMATATTATTATSPRLPQRRPSLPRRPNRTPRRRPVRWRRRSCDGFVERARRTTLHGDEGRPWTAERVRAARTSACVPAVPGSSSIVKATLTKRFGSKCARSRGADDERGRRADFWSSPHICGHVYTLELHHKTPTCWIQPGIGCCFSFTSLGLHPLIDAGQEVAVDAADGHGQSIQK